ncbi:MAG: hypothetical protein ACOX05_04725 [Bacillota bacterium]|jgi:hypothetical protein
MYEFLIYVGIGVALVIIMVRVLIMTERQEGQEKQEEREQAAADNYINKVSENFDKTIDQYVSDEVLLEILEHASTEEEISEILTFAQESMSKMEFSKLVTYLTTMASKEATAAKPSGSPAISDDLGDTVLAQDKVSDAVEPVPEESLHEADQGFAEDQELDDFYIAGQALAQEAIPSAVNPVLGETSTIAVEREEIKEITGSSSDKEQPSEVSTDVNVTKAAQKEQVFWDEQMGETIYASDVLDQEKPGYIPEIEESSEYEIVPAGVAFSPEKDKEMPPVAAAEESLGQSKPSPAKEDESFQSQEELSADELSDNPQRAAFHEEIKKKPNSTEEYEQQIERLDKLFQEQMAAIEKAQQEIRELSYKRDQLKQEKEF